MNAARNTAQDTADDGTTALLETATAFQRAQLLLAGLDLGLFDLLAEGPADAATVRDRLGLHPRGTDDYLAALTETGLLEHGPGGYRNSPAAGRHLVRDAPAYLGGFLRAADQVMYPAWGRLATALRTGEPQAATYSGNDMFGQLYGDDDKRSAFVRMAEDASRPLVPALTRAFDWENRSSVLELGGCRGNVLAGLVAAHPHLTATVLDLPALREEFDTHMKALGTTGRITFHGADFFTDPLPPADVVMIGHCLVDWTDEQRRALVRAVHPAVRPGGAFLVWDPMIVPGAESCLRNLIRSLNLQLMTPHGTNYRLDDLVRLLRTTGFADVRHRPLGQDVTLVAAYKTPDTAA
ncbi:O-methyltransferase [Streptomyces mashuensis]|uniref:O-methyltransferase n=1 Tax=Streptomyces mashuensis TaxID=33904 RepID=A0A919B953_9ACTN|nr:methyltransferase [Streptomyces mashuensis]GHF65490.1 O-methyltransferase [Streptomyces mashuensis]